MSEKLPDAHFDRLTSTGSVSGQVVELAETMLDVLAWELIFA